MVMREKKGFVFGIFELVLLVLSVFYLGINVYKDYLDFQRDSEIHFQRLANQTILNAEVTGFMSEDFVKEQIQFWNNNPGGVAFVITASQGTVMAYPADSKYLERNSYGVPKLKTSSPLLFTKGKALNVKGERNVTITAVYSSLDLSNSLTYIRNSFLLFFTVTVLGFIFIIAGKLKNNDSENENNYLSYRQRVSDIINSEQKIKALDELNYEEDLKQYSEFDNSAMDIYNDGEEENHWDNSAFKESNDPYNTNIVQKDENDFPLPPLENIIDDDISFPEEEQIDNPDIEKDIPEINNTGIYSPVTGIVSEDFLKERLSSELERATRDVQDIALIIIRIKYLERSDYIMRNIIDTIKNAYVYKDMIFEYGVDGIAVLLPNTDIENALKSSENIYDKIHKIISDSGYTNQIGIGLTVKSSRIVEKDRFIDEAVTACKKALLETKMPIVAFNPNPEKYRNFISEQ